MSDRLQHLFVKLSTFIIFWVYCYPIGAETVGGHENTSFSSTKSPGLESWSFSSLFGTYDKYQLQRGLKIYTNVCSKCHTLKFISFKDLTTLGYSSEQIRIFASGYSIPEGEDVDGHRVWRAGRMTDYFPPVYLNDEQARLANQGMIPPDLSMIVKERNHSFEPYFDRLINNPVHSGSDYIYKLLLGYRKPSRSINVPNGKYYNPQFKFSDVISMPPPLKDLASFYKDKDLDNKEQYARDVTAFLTWASDPNLEIRKKIGFRVLLFLIVFAIVLFFLKRKIWKNSASEEDETSNIKIKR